MRDDHVFTNAVDVDGVLVDLIGGFEEDFGGVVFLFSHVLGGETVEEFLWHHTATVDHCLEKFGLWHC